MAAQGVAVIPARTAPPIDDLLPGSEKRPPATSRALLLVTYLAVLTTLAMRVPQTYEHLREHVPAGISAEIHDPDMEALALKTGVFFALAVTALAVGIFFALAVILEKRVFTANVFLGPRVSIGLYALVVALCVLPPQVVSAVSGIWNLHVSPLLYLYVACVGLLSPLLYHRTWRALPARSIAIIFMTSAGLAALTVIG